MEDASLTLNDKGEVEHTSGLAPPSSFGTIVAAALLTLADSSNEDLYLPAIHAPPGPRTNYFSGNRGPTKTKIATEQKPAKEAKQKEAKGKKAATAACKADNLAKKQEKGISSAKAKASTAAAKTETLRSKLADVMKSAAIPEAAHHHKKSKGMLGTVPTNSPLAHTLPLSSQWKLMSTKKRVSMQSSLHSSYDKEDNLSLDGSIMLISSRSSGTSLTTTVEREYGGADTLLMPIVFRHVSLGCSNPAQGRGGLRYSAPHGCSCGRQTERRAPSGASFVNGGYQDKNGGYQDKSAAGGGVKKHLGEQCNAGGACSFLAGGDPHNDLKTDDSDSTDGFSFGSDSHLDNALAHSLCKRDSGAKSPRGSRKGAWSVDPDGEGSIGLTDDDASQSVVSPPCVSGSCWGKDKGDNLHSLQGVNKAMRSPPAYRRGGGKKILHSMDWHREEEAILSGIWPGVSDTSLLTHFISRHFDGDPEVNVPFSCWANSCFQEDPDVEICLWEWTSLYSGKSPQGEAAEVNFIDNVCNKTCVGVTFIKPPAQAKQLYSASTAVKNQSPCQRVVHCNIRSMFPKASKRTLEQVSLDHVIKIKMEHQEHEEAWIRLRLEALKDKYDTAVCIKLSAQASITNVTWSLQQNVAAGAGRPFEQPNGQEVTTKDAVLDMTKESLEDVEMEDTEPTSPISGVQQVPPAVQWGSKHRLAPKAAKLAKQLKD